MVSSHNGERSIISRAERAMSNVRFEIRPQKVSGILLILRNGMPSSSFTFTWLVKTSRTSGTIIKLIFTPSQLLMSSNRLGWSFERNAMKASSMLRARMYGAASDNGPR